MHQVVPRRPPRITRRSVVAGLALVALALMLGGSQWVLRSRSIVAVPLPIYEIEAVSGSHHASLLNLGLPNVGAPQTPIPVDINGDLLPDVTASVNLIDAEGLFNNPPAVGEVIAPNIEINRLFTAPILTPGGDPLRINVKLTIIDLAGQQDPTKFRFGYDTGPGGTIPPNYKAIVGGLESFFDPLVARIDTTGGLLIGLDPTLPDLGLAPLAPAYDGPLTTFADIDSGAALKAQADMRFHPVPPLTEISFGSGEGSGQRFTFAHSDRREVDLDIVGGVAVDRLEADIEAAIDRLPRQVAVHVATGRGGGGGVQYASDNATGRLPDLRAEVELHPPGSSRPIIGRIEAESLPDTLGAQWEFTEGGAPQVTFEGSGQGIGAIETRIQNYEGEPSAFKPHVPGERQHVSIQAGPGGPLVDDTLLQARLERIRGAEVHGTDDGAIVGSVRVGDGERPIEVHGELDLRGEGLPYIDATATISPLPDEIDFAITPSISPAEPLRVVYEPSESIDVDTEALVALPGTAGVLECGDAGTACAEVDLRNVPTRIEARLANLETESRVEIDAIPREGAAALDVFGNATLGPVTDLGAPVDSLLAEAVHVEVAVQGLPRFMRVRTVERPGGGVERVDVRSCDLDYATGECAPATSDEVAEMTFAARNFHLDDRPADLPPPPQSGPLYVTVGAQGLPDTNELVHWEATGRMTSFRELTYLGAGDVTATRVDIGGNQDFRAFVDLDDIDLNGGDPDDGRVDVDADVLVERLPAPLTFCMAQEGRPLTDTPLDPITASCENPDPFGDDSVDTGPLTIHYSAPGSFSVHTDAAIAGDLPFPQPELPIDFGEIHRIAAAVDLTDIPGEFTGYVGSLVDGAVGEDGTQPTATRVRTVAPGADLTKLALTAEVTTEGVLCEDPDPVGGAVCASLVVDGLPEFASVLVGATTEPGGTGSGDDALVSQDAAFLACDLDLATDGCRPGTEGSIGEIDVDVRTHAGDPTGVPAYVPPADEPHAYAQADVDSLGDLEMEAGVQIFDLRQVRVSQSPDGRVVATDVGDGQLPLTVHAYADLRDTVALVPDALRAQAVADLVLDPLPRTVEVEMTGPGENQSDPVLIHADASQASLLTVDAEVRELGVPDGAPCGARGTYCAGLVVDRLPNLFDAAITRQFGDIADPAVPERDVQTHLVLSQSRFEPFADKANVEVHAGIGLPIEAPVIGDGPVFADLVLTGVPDHLAVGLDSHEVLEQGAAPGEYDVEASALQRVQVHTCRRDFQAEACEPGTEDQLDLLELSARTFRLRPTDVPAPLAGGPPLYVGVTGRGTDTEAVVEIPAISEFQFLNREGVTGITARAGGGTPLDPKDLQVRVDVQDLPVAPRMELGGLHVVDPMASLDATVDITPFPGELALCLRNGGATPVPASSGVPFVAVCEDTDPFGDGQALSHTPLSVGFDANQPFDVHVAAELGLDGLDEDEGLSPIDTRRLFATLDMTDLPSDLELHFLQPKETDVTLAGGEQTTIPQGPYRGLLHTTGADSGLDVSLSAGLLIGADTICEDPRPGRSATCVSLGSATTPGIQDLPTDVELFYDPDVDPYDPAVDLGDPADLENFVLRTDGTGGYDTQINDLRVSTMNPPLQLPELDIPLIGELATDAIVVEADLGDVPQPFDLRGTLLLTDTAPTAIFEVQDGGSVPGADIHVRNFLSPDPTVGLAAPDRPVADDPTIPTYTVEAFQRGPAARVEVNLLDSVHPLGIRSFGLRPVRSADDRHPLGTTVIDAGFASDFNVRAYVDLLPEPGTRIIGDVLVGDMPAHVGVCVRGPRAQDPETGEFDADLPYLGTGTWCDDPANLEPGEAGLQVDQQPNALDRTMDLDAFARLEYGGGSSVVAGRVDIDEMPQVLQARFPGGFGKNVEVNSFSREVVPPFPFPTLQPDGIDRIRVEAASFDLDQEATGIVGPLPYSPLVSTDPSLRAKDPPAGGGEYVHGAADLSAGTDALASVGFHVRAQLGRDDAAPSSQLHTFQFTGERCPVPTDESGAPRADYPRLPDDGTGYTCIRTVFDDSSSGTNPLSLDASVLLEGDQLVRLHDAGLSDIPDWIQVQLAEAETFTDPENNRGWRRPCPDISDTSDTGGCMAPRLRFDQPAESHLFGQVEYGRASDLLLLDDPSTDPNELAPNFDAIPTGAGWDDPDYDEGVRVKVLNWTGGTVTDLSDDRQAIRAGLRLQVPGSIQVEQVQNFALDLRQKNQDGEHVAGDNAKDLRLAFTVRDTTGAVRPSVGELSAMLHLVETDSQLLLTKPCETDVAAFDATEPRVPCDRYTEGVEIPGHVAMTINMRDNLTEVGDQLRSSTLIQVDGRITTTPDQVTGDTGIDIGARLLGNDFAVLSGGPSEGTLTGDGSVRVGTAEVVLRNLPGTASLGSHVYEPDFRFRTELVSDGAKPEDDPDPSTFSEQGTITESRPNEDGLNEWYEFTLNYDVGIENALVGFDMNPHNQVSTQAKQLDAVIFMDVPRIGADVHAFTAIGGSTPAEISVGASVAVTPLDVDISSNSNIGANLNELVQTFIEEEIGAPGWLADVIGVIISPITAAIDAVINAFDLGVRLQSDLLVQFTVDRLSEFQLRNNILHVNMDGEGAGEAEFGPINWYVDEFAGGVDLEIPAIEIPDWICWVPGVPCSIGGWNILLAGYSYLEGIPAGSFGLPIAMDFRDCDAAGGFASVVPFLGGGFDNTVTLDPGGVDGIAGALVGGDDEDFVMWVGTDPRMSFSGLLVRSLDLLTFGGFSSILDVVVDVVAGPILCHIDDLSVDAADFVAVNYSASQADYHPGTPSPNRFPGHPVPGQPETPLFAPEGTEDSPVGPIEFPPVDPSSPPLPEPPAPPVALDPLYAGDDVTVSSPAALCGIHELNSLLLASGADVTVATAQNPDPAANPLGTGVPCPAGSEGTLEIRANTITVAPGASITADGIAGDIPSLGTPFADDFRATGSSGGTNAGVGFDGSAPSSGFLNYEGGTEDTRVYSGGPGSSVGTGFDLQSIAPTVAEPDIVDSAGAGGLGGGAIVLKADRLLSVAGTVSADGSDGAGSTAGECDSDAFEDPSNDIEVTDDDGNVVEVIEVPDDPPYEHVSGSIGAGGGAGGGIALQARTEISITGTLSATGGSGGDGVLGAGGGGGGGAIKVLAPVTSGAAGLSSNVVAGANGDAGVLCPGIPPAATPTFDDPTTPADDDPAVQPPQQTDGLAVVVDTPSATLRPYGPDWWAGGDRAPQDTFDGYLVGGGGAGTTVHVCAVSVPLGSFYDADPFASEADIPFTPWDETRDDPVPTSGGGMVAAMNRVLPRVEVDEFGNQLTFGTLPTAANPCGEPAPDHTLTGAVDIVPVTATSVAGAVVDPVPVALDIDGSGLYGLFTTAVRGGDVEILGAVEWATKVDATRPNVEIAKPVDDPTPTEIVAATVVEFVADDILVTDVDFAGSPLQDVEFTLSGLNRVECRIYDEADTPSDDDWSRCTSGQLHELLQPDGVKIVEVRAFDNAGNVSNLTDDVDGDGRDGVADVILDISPPEADLLLQGGTQGGTAPDPDPDDGEAAPNWYRVAPSLRITDYQSEAPSALTPYVYRFDNGAEFACDGGGTPTPPDCLVPSAEVDSRLATGRHTVHYTAVNAGGNRYRDDDDARTPSPMPFEHLFLDTEAPLVEVTTVPLRPDQSLAGADWYDDPVAVVLASIDQFGGSGLDQLEYRFGLAGPFTGYDPMNPPMAPAGESDFCYRVDDVAGNEIADCVELRVDATPPAFSLAPNIPPDGEAGWYVTAPTFTVSGFDDGPDGVGADTDHFRTRVDNEDAVDCDAPSCVVPYPLATGQHLVHASAADRFGNRAGEQTVGVNVDLEPPVVVPVIGPAEPDGEHGWWHRKPFLTLVGVDPGAGSGIDELEYSLNGGATYTPWTEPVHVGAGEHTLCWRGDDVAGNDADELCRDFFVDLDDPTAAVTGPATPAGGWFTADVALGTTAADAVPGAGLGADPSEVCEDLTPGTADMPATAISGLCLSVDGGPYVPAGGGVSAGEGIHFVRAYSIDRSGRRSAVAERVVRVDESAPVVEPRLLPPAPARNGWYRTTPLVVLKADDGDDGSGVQSLQYRVGTSGPWLDYVQPFELAEGMQTVQFRASDIVGTRTGELITRIDTTSPRVVATTPSKVLWLRLLGGTNQLRYTLADNLSGPVRVTVTVFDATMNPVRRLHGGVVHVTPGAAPILGSVTWDGRDDSLLNLVPLGVYYYRVTATDDAGNVAFSGESQIITIRLL